MSALASLWHFDGRQDAQLGCERMLAAQQLYGPHAAGYWSSGSIALGRRLMHLLPEDRFDRQPLTGSRGNVVLVADLRLDNRDDLIRLLDIAQTRARFLSDADILFAALERWDEACLERLVGDYAFIRWNSTKHEMLLVRDPLGQRPLHYHQGNGFFAVASMPKGLHALPEVPYGPDQDRITKWLALQQPVGTQTFFCGVERVEPGHVVRVTPSGVVARRFWLPRRHTIVLKGPQEYAEALRERLDQAVYSRLRSVRGIGAHLSSGFDSSAVSATAARLLAPCRGKVVAFTAAPREGYDGPSPPNRIADESPLAAATASLYTNMEHVLIRSVGKSPLDELDRNFIFFEQPIQNACNMVWHNSINDAAQERRLGVLLAADTGNITLSYDGLLLLPELFRQGRLINWWRESRAIVARRGLRWRGVVARTFGPWVPGEIWTRIERLVNGTYPDILQLSAIHPERLAKLNMRGRRRRIGGDSSFQRRLDSFCSVDFGNFNKGILGGWQIDRRDPTADLRLIEFCLAVPTDQFQREGVTRALARLALSDRLPRAVLDEPKRGIQAADWHERLRADRIATELDRFSACPEAAQALDLERLRMLVENWPSDGWERDEVSATYRGGVLRAFTIGHFLRSVCRQSQNRFLREDPTGAAGSALSLVGGGEEVAR
jgi:asparagine synthase (glutamine-hydrolysing)